MQLTINVMQGMFPIPIRAVLTFLGCAEKANTALIIQRMNLIDHRIKGHQQSKQEQIFRIQAFAIMANIDVDVLIVGGGPTGLMLALELAMQDISFRIVDATAVRSDKSRAVVIHPRSLELLNRHGLADQLIKHGRLNSAIRLFSQKAFVLEVELKDASQEDSAYPEPLMISQADTEEILDETLFKYNGKKVERPVTVSNIEQDEICVSALLSRPDGDEERVRCKYVAGCDGAHSIVRRSAGLTFDGAAYATDFILADVKAKWEIRTCLHGFLGNAGFLVVVPLKNGYSRLICTRGPQSKDVDPTLKDFEEIVANLVPGDSELSDPIWMTQFHIHHRIASNYRSGRMFVAGDAAHIHSPAGGQGMNTGIQDAVNLGWKLAAVLKGQRPDSFLDTYHIERYKVGQKLLQGTDRLFEFTATTNPIYVFLRNLIVLWLLPLVMRNPTIRRNRFRFVSQLAIRYHNSPIVSQASNWKGALKGGNRAPNGELRNKDGATNMLLDLCRGSSYHLILFAGENSPADAAALERAVVEIMEKNKVDDIKSYFVFTDSGIFEVKPDAYVDVEGSVHRLYGLEESGFVLVRADGYVAFIGGLDAVLELEEFMKKQEFGE